MSWRLSTDLPHVELREPGFSPTVCPSPHPCILAVRSLPRECTVSQTGGSGSFGSDQMSAGRGVLFQEQIPNCQPQRENHQQRCDQIGIIEGRHLDGDGCVSCAAGWQAAQSSGHPAVHTEPSAATPTIQPRAIAMCISPEAMPSCEG